MLSRYLRQKAADAAREAQQMAVTDHMDLCRQHHQAEQALRGATSDYLEAGSAKEAAELWKRLQAARIEHRRAKDAMVESARRLPQEVVNRMSPIQI